MIQWFNSNQGFVLALLTLVYVVTTIFLAYLNKRSLALIETLERSRLRPYVLFNLEDRQKAVHAVLRNNGLSVAKNIALSVEPELTTAIGSSDRSCILTQRPLLFLAPSQEVADLLGGSPAFDQKFRDVVFRAKVEYDDASGRHYQESTEISLWHTMNRYHTSTEMQDLVSAAKRGVDALDQIARRSGGA